jgi:hypothetical protein
MAMKGHKPGGGIASKQHVQTRVRTGTPRKRVNVAGVNQQGAMVGDHTTHKGTSTGYRGVQLFGGAGYPSKLGNEVALNVGKGGPGAGRKVYGCGTQGVQGSVNPGQASPKRDILSEFGPDSKRS